MPAGAQRPRLGSAAAEVRGRGVPVPAGEAPAFGFGVPVADDRTVGLGTTAGGVGEGLCHGLPYAADGSPSGPCAAVPDDAITLDSAAADPAASGAGWALPNRQAATASTARPPASMKNRRRQ